MRTHVTTLVATLACASAGLLALPVAGAAAADGSPVLPGDVRAAEHALPSGADPAVVAGAKLPGDVRVLDDGASRGVRAVVPLVSTRVVKVDDSNDLLEVGLGALAGMVVASAVAVGLAGRRPRATTA